MKAMRILGFFLMLTAFYIIGSWIALESNPTHWALFNNTWGRTIFAIFFIALAVTAYNGDLND